MLFPDALALAHLARAEAASLALAAALNRLRFLAGFPDFLARYLAHRALAAAAMARRPAADILRRPLGLPGPRLMPPSLAMESSWFSKSSICCLISMMRWSCAAVSFANVIMGVGFKGLEAGRQR